MPLYILGGGQIADGNVLELTLYSKRYETQPINFLNENLDAILGNGGNYGNGGWWIDFSTKRFIQYASGIQDHVHNAGSRFVEQRYIVDKSSPTLDVTSPGVSCDGTPVTTPIEPGVDYTFTADLSDGEYGSGIKASTVTVNISGPTGPSGVIPIANKEITATHVKFTMLKPILVGQYNVRITGEDNLGNKFDKTCVIYVGSSILTLSQVTAYPNPFNPREADMSFSFINDRTADVTITVYDFNGDKVKTIRPGNLSVGTQVIKWGGDAEDGTPLANGVYLARIEANDGRRTQTQTIKVALWRD